jgi:hypothetical protein
VQAAKKLDAIVRNHFHGEAVVLDVSRMRATLRNGGSSNPGSFARPGACFPTA